MQSSPKVNIPATFEQLLGGKPFLDLGGQLLYLEDGQHVLTRISGEYSYTASAYDSLPEGAPFQLIQSKLIYMPSPTFRHQKVLGRLHASLLPYVESHHLGEVLMAPMDVYLDNLNVYQPDLLFISRARTHIIGNKIQGAPDLVVEVLSPATSAYDKIEKREIYGHHGVKEYWLVSPEENLVEVFRLESGNLMLQAVISRNSVLETPLFPGWHLELNSLFEGI